LQLSLKDAICKCEDGFAIGVEEMNDLNLVGRKIISFSLSINTFTNDFAYKGGRVDDVTRMFITRDVTVI